MSEITGTKSDDLGAGHFMDTEVWLHTDNGHIDAVTRTQTVTWFGGFEGGVSLIFYDGNDVAIGQSWEHAFGVDGTMVGRSDRRDYWGEDIDTGIAGRTVRFDILQYWAPKWGAVNNIVARAVEVGKTAEPLLQELRDAGLIG